jgi:protein-tyrosine phosphatase
MIEKVLVVCVGNVCRSPTAERMLRKLLPNKVIESAGIAALVGKPANNTASKIAIQNALNLEGHCARQLTTEMCGRYDLLLVMEKGHMDAVYQMAPQARGKTMLLNHWLDGSDIPDPYRHSNDMYQHVYQLLDNATKSWLQMLG